jgi:hypothetical protein
MTSQTLTWLTGPQPACATSDPGHLSARGPGSTGQYVTYASFGPDADVDRVREHDSPGRSGALAHHAVQDLTAAVLILDFQNDGVHPQGYWATHGEPDWPAIATPAVDNTAGCSPPPDAIAPSAG